MQIKNGSILHSKTQITIMKIFIFFITYIFTLLFNCQAQMPGSGRNLNFTQGEGDFMESVTSNSFNTTGSYTIEGWYYWNNDPAANTNFCFEIGEGSTGYKYMWNNRTNLFGSTNGMTLGFRAADGSYNDFVFNYTPPQNRWVHLAYTWNSAINEISFFANGFLIGSRISFKTPSSAGANAKLYIGKQFSNIAPTFEGAIDEFRMFNINLPQNTFYNRMCKKIAPTDALYNNLICYYDFDHAASLTTPDRSTNGINISAVTATAPMSELSGAPVGNICGVGFNGSASAYILTNTARGDRIIATLTGGNADGIAVYAVTENPSNTNGQLPLAGNNGYFGVFPLNGTDVTYKIEYDYDGINIAPNNDEQLLLYRRPRNNSSTWSKMPIQLDSSIKTMYAYTNGFNSEIMVGLYNPINSKKPGSGNAVNFTNSFIRVDNNPASNKPTKQLSVTAWVKIAANNPLGGIVSNAQDNGTDEAGFYLFTSNGTNNVEFGVKTANNTFGNAMPAAQVPLNKWTHIAGTYDGANIRLYINGILRSVVAATGDIDWSAINPTVYAIGSYVDADENNPFNGTIDEVSVWSKALNINEIRDRMCRKITNSDPLHPFMVSYFNFDDDLNGNTAYDGTIFENNGIYYTPSTVGTVVSGAPIGNKSSHDYVSVVKAPTLGAIASLNETFAVVETSGAPEGIHLYHVNEKPNTETGIAGVGDNNRYFGVYQVNGTNPVYQAVYIYDGNPYVNTLNEPTIALFKRNENSITSWSNTNAMLNTSANTLSLLGHSTEYMLGNTLIPLPLKEINLTGTIQNNKTVLHWTTTGELNIRSHAIQGSTNGINFTTVNQVNSKGDGSNSYSNENSFANNITYFRILTTDINGQKNYSNVVKVNHNKLLYTISPNLVSNFINVVGITKPTNYSIKNVIGQVVKTGIVQPNQAIEIKNITPGQYTITVVNTSIKFLVQ